MTDQITFPNLLYRALMVRINALGTDLLLLFSVVRLEFNQSWDRLDISSVICRCGNLTSEPRAIEGRFGTVFSAFGSGRATADRIVASRNS